MKLYYFASIFCLISLMSCNRSPKNIKSELLFSTLFIENSGITSTSTIHINGLTLITKNIEKDKPNALEILKLKHKWPLAMKTKNKELFEEILASDFLIKGEDEFLTREDYINDRINGTWEIDSVIYKNLVLQFYGKDAVLTYKNTLYGKDDNGIPDIEHYSWTDVYTKEKGSWKILSSNCIEGRVEYK